MTNPPQTFVIVGAGLAGAKAAETLRDEGFDGRLVLVGDEPERPYERPQLSKEFLRGETTEPPFVHPEDFYSDNDVELLSSTEAIAVDADNRQLVLADDERLGYDRLLLTTGAEPRRLDVPGAELEGVRYLRNLPDSRAIGSRLEAGGRIVVVGSGWIGAEIAASARQKGCEVTMIEMASLPLERVLGEAAGQIYLDLHRSHGVEFLPETTVERMEGQGGVERVHTRDGAVIETDCVVVGIGVVPRTGLGESAGIRLDNGISVNEQLETAVPGVFAAGDVANAQHAFYGRRVRVEHWANALHQGPVAARAMLGQPVVNDEIPYFFSDQYESGMEYRGDGSDWDEVVFRGDPSGGEFIVFWLKDSRLVAGMNVNVWDVSEPIGELIRSRRRLDRRELEDVDTSIEELAGAGSPS